MHTEYHWWIFALLSAIFAALTTISAKIGVESVNSNLATALRTIVILVIAWGIVGIEGQFKSVFQIAPKTLFFLALSGVTTGLSWLCYFRALQMAPASWVAPLDKSSLVFVILFAALLLKEPLTLKAILGTIFMLAGILILVV
ncbi:MULTISPECIES: EamA family transporter [unclassified Leptolyngbya]|uniref:EamA family transporter n=1 Tax=unclassified Leptolyngbya TaxID=2650499 RepID=UPI0016841632|nr:MULTISPECIES: EamA family transporter [unclassified Leptolyngbya]MBD1909257.1 EamA family transporter [Leptolyngbya sp. FACHB-8]MBD2154257.1 EamA family transporter [Leptolyngbya sp. FACHB-16]